MGFSIVYDDEVPRLKIPTEISLLYLLKGQSQFIKTEHCSNFKAGGKIELVKEIGKAFYVYPVVVISVEESRALILVETDYSFGLHKIGEMLNMRTLSRRRSWPPRKNIAAIRKDGQNILFDNAAGIPWAYELDDSSERDWGIIVYFVDEI